MHKEFLYLVEVGVNFIFLHAFFYSVLKLKEIFLIFFVDWFDRALGFEDVNKC